MGWQEIKNIKQSAANKKPRTRYINPKSGKRVIEEKEYLKKREVFLKKHPVCKFPNCDNMAVELHHAKGRVGKNYLDEKTFVALCRQHHDFCNLNPKIALRMKLSNSRLKKA